VTAQHRDPVAPGSALSPRPQPGPIAVLPMADPLFVRAIEDAGGSVAPLDDDTRGIVWLAAQDPRPLASVLAAHPDVSWVQLPWAGVDAFADVLASYAEHDGAPVFTSAKGAYAEPVAEHALGLTIATLRELPRKARSSAWDGEKAGVSLYGLEVLIVGAGGIAIELMRLLEPFRARVTIVRRTDAPLPGAARTVSATELMRVLPDADVVIVAAASTTSTARMFGAAQFAAMKSSAVFVNVARGPLVDTDALVTALASGTIAGAGIDVTDPEPLPDGHALWQSPNTVVTSHAADTPEMVRALLAVRVGRNVEALLGDARFVGVVDPVQGY
jgi:phosphoglycerate dehydrogenase-like enzyme